jgi:parvulin-like peptidyl-prolyl isomerase
MKLDLLDKLIEDRLILQEANKNKLALDKARVAAKINEVKSRYASEGEFQNVLKRQGLVQADLEAKIKEQLLMYSVIETEVRAKIIVNPTEVTDFYQKNTQEFIFPEQREFVYLTVKDERLIQEISKDLRANNDLGAIAKKYSLGVNKMSARKNHELREEIEKGIFNLKVREVSKPIKDENNFYIFKLINIIAPRQQSLSEVQDEIYNFLYEKKMQEGLSSWLDALKKNAYIKILSD